MVLSISYIVLFFISTTPFYWGVEAIENFLFIPCSSQKYQKSFEVNSSPLSNLKALTFTYKLHFFENEPPLESY